MQQLTPIHCPSCGMDATRGEVVGEQHTAMPVKGDVAICNNCCALLLFEDPPTSVRHLLASELLDMSTPMFMQIGLSYRLLKRQKILSEATKQ